MTPARPPRRQEDRDRATARIVQAATALYHRHGIENVSYGDIARKARVSRPLLYFYFPTPRDLLMAAVLEASRKLHTRFERAIAGAATGLAGTEAIGRAYLAFHAEDPASFFLCMAAGPQRGPRANPTETEQALQAESSASMHLLVAQLERGHRDGSIDPKAGDPLVVALCLWSLSHGLAQFTTVQATALREEYRVDTAAFLDAGMRLLSRALAPAEK